MVNIPDIYLIRIYHKIDSFFNPIFLLNILLTGNIDMDMDEKTLSV